MPNAVESHNSAPSAPSLGPISRFASRLAIGVRDTLRWNPAVRAALCYYQLAAARGGTKDSPQTVVNAIRRLCTAARLAPDSSWLPGIERRIHTCLSHLNGIKLDWRTFVPQVERRRIEKAVVLKPSLGEREKGVVFISFEDQWARLAHQVNLEEFAKSYRLVVSPTWSPPHDPVNCLFPLAYPGPIFCLISNQRDLNIFPRLSSKYIMVPLYAASWVNPANYQPVPFARKDVDILMLANFAKYKRHFLLFRALQKMPASVRVVLIGQPCGGRQAADLRAEAAAYGVENRFELLENAPNPVVWDFMSRAKISMICSRREGSCVVLVESMLANTPVGILEDAEIGARAFINSSTGRLLQYRKLPEQLMDFISCAGGYTPRPWAEQNVTCHHSTRVLNDALKADALASGEDWTTDIGVLQWIPDPRLLNPQNPQLFDAAYEDIRSRFGIEIGPTRRPAG